MGKSLNRFLIPEILPVNYRFSTSIFPFGRILKFQLSVPIAPHNKTAFISHFFVNKSSSSISRTVGPSYSIIVRSFASSIIPSNSSRRLATYLANLTLCKYFIISSTSNLESSCQLGKAQQKTSKCYTSLHTLFKFSNCLKYFLH